MDNIKHASFSYAPPAEKVKKNKDIIELGGSISKAFKQKLQNDHLYKTKWSYISERSKKNMK